MKRLALLAVFSLALSRTFAADTPRGSLLELHSCELYAGGCVISSESTLNGHYMLRAWDFAAGKFNGADLKGLQVAVLQSSPDNLAADNSKSGEAVVYLPQNATAAQRDALLAWLKSGVKDFQPAKIQTRVASLRFERTEKTFAFSAGAFVSVKTSSETCPINCGDTLWYQPRMATSLFTVAVNEGSRVQEPLLNMTWNDSDRRTIFLGRFGESDAAKNVFVSMNELCGTKNAF